MTDFIERVGEAMDDVDDETVQQVAEAIETEPRCLGPTGLRRTLTEPCPVCDGTGNRPDTEGVLLDCRGCDGAGKQTTTEVIRWTETNDG